MTIRPTNKSTHFSILDGLRGVAAVCVVLLHLTRWPVNFAKVPPYGNWLAHSYLAVDFFFLLSGFVIAHAYERRLSEGLPFLDFLRARLVRLYPMFFMGLVLGTLAMAVAQPWGLNVFLFFRQALFIPTYHKGDYTFPYNMPAWSLMFEMFINLAYAFFLPWLRTRVMIGIVGFSALILVAAGWFHDGVGCGGGFPGMPFGLPRVTFGFLYGVLLYRAYQAGLLPKVRTSALAVFAALLALLVIPLGHTHLTMVYDMFCLLVAFPAIIIFALPITRKNWFFTFSGDISYPIYAIHCPVIIGLIGLVDPDPMASTAVRWLTVLVLTLICIASSWILLKVYDEPVRKLLKPAPRRRGAVANAPHPSGWKLKLIGTKPHVRTQSY